MLTDKIYQLLGELEKQQLLFNRLAQIGLIIMFIKSDYQVKGRLFYLNAFYKKNHNVVQTNFLLQSLHCICIKISHASKCFHEKTEVNR